MLGDVLLGASSFITVIEIELEHQLVKPFGLERSQNGLTKLPLFLFRIFVVTNYFNREQHLPTTLTFASSAVHGGELLETRFN